MRIPSGVVDQYIYFVAVDVTDLKTRETGLTGFTVYRSRDGAAAAAYTTPTVNETDVTNMPGVYELLLDEDMTIAAGNDSEEVCLHITQASMAPVTRVFELYRRTVTAGDTLVTSSGAVTTVTTTTTATNVTTVNGLAANVITATSINADAITAAKIADGAIDAATFAAGAITATVIATGAIDADALAADAGTEIAAAVWNEDATGHQTQGTFGQAIGDPVADTNTIFKAVVTDATGATVGVDVVAVKAETVTILADTDNIQTRLPAALVSGRMDASVGAMAAGVLTAAAIDADAITDAKVAADVTIASVTGAVGSVTGAVGSVTGSVGSVTGAVGSVTGAVGSVTGLTASDVGAIKAKTDSLAFTVAGQVDANIQSVNDVTVNGDGSAGTPWGP